MARDTQETVAENFLAFAVHRLARSESEIARCCDRLSDEQMWHRGGEHENSIANLLLHLAGNMRQWILHGIAGEDDVRRRDDEFATVPTMEAREARLLFQATLAECRGVLDSLPPERLLDIIDPQPGGTWRNLTILEAIFQVVGHVQMHAGQIIVLTKQMLAADLDLSMPRKR
jgi:uncharacterized damage-inducible protein DinB